MPFNSIFGWLMKKRMHQIDLFRMYPHEVQQECFERLISAGKQTRYGNKFGFQMVNDYPSFKKLIPLQDYDGVKEWVERAVKGEEDVLWPGETKWFAKSSGTTSDRSKFIPVTIDSLENCHYKGGKDLLAIYYTLYPDSKVYKGKHLVVGGAAEQIHLSGDRYTGDLSAIIIKNLPWWVEIKRTPNREIALMSAWEEKIERLAHSTIKEDVTSISGVPSWTLVLINRILEITGKKSLLDVWPNLELYMHGGVSFEPYRKEFERIIPSKNMRYFESYNASEGFFGIQDEEDGNLLLMLDYGVFYEFIPMEHFNGINSEHVVSLKEVKLGENYAVVISTNGGLWRYILGDTIRFTNLTPYKFKITGRTKHFINVFGEELVVENADKAIAYACEKTGAAVSDYTACPIYMENTAKGGHEWVLAFSKAPEDKTDFMKALDMKLRAVNSDYDAKRTNDLTLQFPILHVVEQKLFDDWLKRRGKLGGQHKIPRLVNDRKIFDEIMATRVKDVG